MKLECITTTFYNNCKEISKQNENFMIDEGIENEVINLYPQMRYQTFEGFGGAITDSAGYVYSQMGKEDKEVLLDSYFKETNLAYCLTRIHMDSCDFSLEHYEAMSDSNDRQMQSFDLARSEKYIFPMLEEAQMVTDAPIRVMVSPWSPPSFMKTNGERNHGGKLKDEYKPFWADYICRYIKELRKRGYNVTRMSLQNEPNATQTWDSCVYTPSEEKEFLRDYMYPTLEREGLSDIEIFIWDHNKERLFERACEIIDEDTNHMIDGIAFHWYSGDHFEALDMVRDRYPDKKLILSEACIEYCKYSKDDYLAKAQKYAHDIIGNINHGMNAFYDWNIVLNEQGGPNHVGNFCDAPYLYDMEQKVLIERNTLAYIYHFSHFIMPGAIRIGHSRYTDRIEVTALENPDGTIVVVLLNRTDRMENAVLRLKGNYAKVELKPLSISTCVILF